MFGKKIQIASDLHLEFPENRDFLEKNPIIPKAKILLLAGDIVSDNKRDKAEFFFKKWQNDFKLIIEVPGNHDYYGGTISSVLPSWHELAPNHVKMNNTGQTFYGIKFICSTLWSYVPSQSETYTHRSINDYHQIRKKSPDDMRNLTVKDTNEFNKISVAYLYEELQKPFDGKIVVLTHHLPSNKCISPKFYNSPLNPAFVNSLDDLIQFNQQISLWVHGHSHDFRDIKIGNTRVVRNPLGYVEHEGITFKKDFVVKI